MGQLSILVTGIGGDIGENIIKCLRESNYNLKIYGCDINKYASGKRMVSEFFQAPYAEEENEYAEFLKNIILKKKIDYIFPSSEIEIEFLNRNRDLFNNFNVGLIINTKNILHNFLDKYNTAIFLKQKRLPYPKTFLLNQYNNELEYPLIIKRRKGSGSKLVLIVNNRREFEFYVDKYKNEDLIVQEYIGDVDNEYTIGVFSNRENTYSISFRRYLSSDVGITRYAELVMDKDIEWLGQKIAEVTKLEGALNIQARKTERGIVPFEINPRISGTAYVRHHIGFKDVQWWLDLYEKKPIQYIPSYKHAIAVRSIVEVFYDLY